MKVALVFSGILMLLNIQASACTCIGTRGDSSPQTITAEFNAASVVAIVEVEHVERYWRSDIRYEYLYELKIVNVFKGKLYDHVDFNAGTRGGDCTVGNVFEVGKKYLIYSDWTASKSRISLWMCSRWMPYPGSEADRQQVTKEVELLLRLNR